jgi:hypothetical protein
MKSIVASFRVGAVQSLVGGRIDGNTTAAAGASDVGAYLQQSFWTTRPGRDERSQRIHSDWMKLTAGKTINRRNDRQNG